MNLAAAKVIDRQIPRVYIEVEGAIYRVGTHLSEIIKLQRGKISRSHLIGRRKYKQIIQNGRIDYEEI